AVLLLLAFFCCSPRSFALGETDYIATNAAPGSFPLVSGTVANLVVDTNDWVGVIRAADDFKTDVDRVTGRSPAVTHALKNAGKNVVIIGTIGKSALVDRLVREKKIDVSPIAGKWESFMVEVVAKPFSGVNSALVICGSDKRGTIYGIYDVSEHIGVSPWHYWADVPTKRHGQLFVKP